MSSIEPRRTLLAWSSGKDSAWSLEMLRRNGDYEVVGLLTTINAAFDRVAMHAVRRELVEAQARAAGLRLYPVLIPWPCSNEAYERAMGTVLDSLMREAGVTHIAFGDLYLEDVRAYRERMFEGSGLTPVFPIWGEPTGALARTMVDAGLRAKVTCIDPKRLPSAFAGRDFDHSMLDDLPADVDPCGEAGEFHTFAYAGPMFQAEIRIQAGEVVARDGFVFSDIRPL